MNVVLTGFMGTGKTTIGRLLADQLGFAFVDTDVVIEERHGPIATIFAEQGEETFRAIERQVAAELAQRTDHVVSTGGRLMLDDDNATVLGRSGHVFCLAASAETILDRVLGDASRVERPLLSVDDPKQRILDLLAERRAGYARFTQVATDDREPGDIADELVGLVRSTNTDEGRQS